MSVALSNCLLEPSPLPRDPSSEASPSRFSAQLFAAALFLGVLLQVTRPAWFVKVLHVSHAGALATAGTLCLATALSVLIHELGHLILSLVVRFRVSRVSFGPISVSRVHDHWKLQYSRTWVSASVSALPPDERAWRTRMLLVVAGGPLATACLFTGAVWLFNKTGPAAQSAALLAGLVEINLLLFVLGLVPNPRNSPVRNDARLFLTILENRKEAEQIKLYQRVTWLQVSGERPSAYPEELITRLAKSEGNYDLMLFAAHTLFMWALDTGKLALADSWDRHAMHMLSLRPLRIADCVMAESAFFDLCYRNLPASAIRKLSAARFQTLPPALQKRAKATLEAAQNDWSEVNTIDSALHELRQDLPYGRFESELLASIKRRAIITSSRTLSAFVAAA
jgi:hypothetical protein